MWSPMLTAGTGVSCALGNNIHIITSVLMHIVLGVFFVTHTDRRPLRTGDKYESFVTSSSMNASEVHKVGEKKSEKVIRTAANDASKLQNAELPVDKSTFPSVQMLPPVSSEKSARMSLAMSSENYLSHDFETVKSTDRRRLLSSEIKGNPQKRDVLQNSVVIGHSLGEYVPDSVVGSVLEQFAECWTIPYDVRNRNTLVRINLSLDPNGKVRTASVADTYLYDHNQLFRALADSALRAVYRCSPLIGLLSADYSLWNEVVLTFDPKYE